MLWCGVGVAVLYVRSVGAVAYWCGVIAVAYVRGVINVCEQCKYCCGRCGHGGVLEWCMCAV